MAIETEIKFRVADKSKLEEQLALLSFRLMTPRSFESNTLYDWRDRSLRNRREILRIRLYNNHWLLTHKRVPDSGVGEDRHKHRVETETEVSDGKALAEVFSSIGLIPAFRYEKWRSEWDDGRGHCVIDETPIGVFAELEGKSEWIDEVTGQLEIPAGDQMTMSYGRLFEQWREQTGSNAEHLTFAEIQPGGDSR